MTITELAKEAATWFVSDTRYDGEHFVKTKDDRPEWISDAIYDAHGKMLPDDWKYDKIDNAFQFIADLSDDSEEGIWDAQGEFADQQVDVYNTDRVKWLESSLHRAGYVDEGTDEFGHSDQGVYGDIAVGQYFEATEIYGVVGRALISRLEDLELEALDAEEVEA